MGGGAGIIKRERRSLLKGKTKKGRGYLQNDSKGEGGTQGGPVTFDTTGGKGKKKEWGERE